MEVGEPHAPLGKRVEVWSIDLAAEASNVCPAQVIGYDQQEVRALLLSRNGRSSQKRDENRTQKTVLTRPPMILNRFPTHRTPP